MALTSASSLSDYLENKLLSFFKGATFPAAPATVYVGLFTTNPADAGTLASPQDGTEMSTTNGTTGYAAYARQSITTASGWNAIAAATGDTTGQQITNNATITFPANNGGSTVTVTGIGIYDASTAGNLLWWAALGSSQQITASAAIQFNATGISVQVD